MFTVITKDEGTQNQTAPSLSSMDQFQGYENTKFQAGKNKIYTSFRPRKKLMYVVILKLSSVKGESMSLILLY